jgi:hypothetical protein
MAVEALPLLEQEAAERQKKAGRQQASHGAEGGRGRKNPLPKKLGKGFQTGTKARQQRKLPPWSARIASRSGNHL